MFPKTIRTQLFLTFGALTTAICLLFSGVTWLFAVIMEDDVIKQVLSVEARFIRSEFQQSGEMPPPRVDYISLYPDESALPDDVRQGYADHPYEKEFTIAGHNFHIEQFWLNDRQSFWLVIDATQLQAIDDLSNFMSQFLVATAAFLLVLSLWFAWRISNRTARPIERLALKVTNHSPGDILTLDDPGREDEVGQLGRAFQRSLEDVSVLLKREMDFTRDVSHELRTPIALLQNILVLAGDKPLGKNDKLLIDQISKELKNTVEVLLALARAENLVFETLLIVPLLERSILSLYGMNRDAEFKVTLDIDEDFEVVGNPYLVSLLCQNLISNGFYHSGAGSMSIRNRGQVLIFENQIVESQSSSYQGLGHGQYLVSRIADNMNWTVDVLGGHDVYRIEVTPVAEAWRHAD